MRTTTQLIRELDDLNNLLTQRQVRLRYSVILTRRSGRDRFRLAHHEPGDRDHSVKTPIEGNAGQIACALRAIREHHSLLPMPAQEVAP